MKRVTFKNKTSIEFDETKLIPKIIKADWRASKLEGLFILNPQEALQGNLLMLGKHQDDKNWICSDYIAKIKSNDLQ